MVLFFAVAGLAVAYFAFIIAFGVLCSIVRGLKRVLVKKSASPKPYKKAPAYIQPRRDFSHVYDDTPSIHNPDFLDVLDAEDAGWNFDLGGYPAGRR